MSTNKRIEKIKAARSIGEIMSVLADIGRELKNSTAIKKLLGSTSAVDADGNVVFDGRNARGDNKIKAEFTPPPAKDVQAHNNVLDALFNNIKELEAAAARLEISFAHNSKAVAVKKALVELLDDVNEKIDKALDDNEKLARSHVPVKFSKLADAIKTYLITTIPGNLYGEMPDYLHVAHDPEDKSLLHFCHYIDVQNFEQKKERATDKHGFRFPHYFFVVTAVVTAVGEMTIYLNSLTDFKLPCTYPLGKEITTLAGAKTRIDALLDHNKFVVDHQRSALPMSEDQLKTSGLPKLPGVASIAIEDNDMIVMLKPGITPKVKSEIEAKTLALLRAMLGVTRSKVPLPQDFTLKGQQGIRFIITPAPGAKKRNITAEMMEEMTKLYGLTRAQQTALRFALQHEGKHDDLDTKHVAQQLKWDREAGNDTKLEGVHATNVVEKFMTVVLSDNCTPSQRIKIIKATRALLRDNVGDANPRHVETIYETSPALKFSLLPVATTNLRNTDKAAKLKNISAEKIADICKTYGVNKAGKEILHAALQKYLITVRKTAQDRETLAKTNTHVEDLYKVYLDADANKAATHVVTDAWEKYQAALKQLSAGTLGAKK